MQGALKISRPAKRAIMVCADLIMLPLALWSAFALRYVDPTPNMTRYWWLFLVTPLLTVPILHVLGLYRAVVRFMSLDAVVAVVKGVTISALIVALASLMGDFRAMPRSVVIIYWLIALLYIGGSRFMIRWSLHTIAKRQTAKAPVVIYGAGTAGVQSCMALMAGTEFEPIAFVDDDRTLQGSAVNGIRVHSPDGLPRLVDEFGVAQVLLAMPSASRGRRREIISGLEAIQIHVRTLPGLSDLVTGRAHVDEFREVEIEDLLGRDPVPPEQGLLESCIFEKTVLVTGAGGSIGSALCRQIVRLGPIQLLLADNSEFALYRIERELKSLAEGIEHQPEIVPLLGSVTNARRMQRIMNGFGVDTVYHAAAFKHVPLVEQNVIEGVFNNVFGMLRCAEAAVGAGVASFVLVSTDKAVRPTNVMGASKRMAELVLQSMSEHQQTTRFAMVRFGNVLDSSGSVVPVFRDQIRKGGPVTVTHPDVTRYFMTIPEAAELVVQAGAMGKGGEVFVLDMGEPVKIRDLAARMIRLMGHELKDDENPDGDIEIRFTGLRPGEKLYEELLIGEDTAPTSHRMIMQAREAALSQADLNWALAELDQGCREFDCVRVRRALAYAVSGYRSQGEIADLLWQSENEEPGKRRPRVSLISDRSS